MKFLFHYFVFFWIIAVLVLTGWNKAEAGVYRESVYQKQWCGDHNGQAEVVLADKTRVDCLIEEYAVEVDFARKWAEAVGQSMHYAKKTKRVPGILLIMEKPKDRKYLNLLRKEFYWIKVWTITPEDVRRMN